MIESKNSIVKISNLLNLTRQEFNTIEKHIFLVTLLNLKDRQGFNLNLDNELEAVKIEFPVKDLKETNRERIKEALDKITSRKIHFDNSKDNDYFGFIVPFISAKYDSRNRSYSNIIIKLNPDCKRLFFELANGYTSADLKAILNLKSVYSIRMYELISMYLKQKSWRVEVNNLKNLLGIELSKYKSFTQFENKILLYSQKELAEHCNLSFTWKIAEKQRKKITALTFYIQSKEQKEKVELNEEIKQTIDFVAKLSPVEIAHTYNLITSKYSLSTKQADYIFSDTKLLNEFIRVDLIIESMIEKGKTPKDRTKYLAKSLGLDKISMK